MAIRKIIKIDETKCNGCGLCIPGCHEGAIRIIDKKARLVSDSLCDGLGACIGHCPQGAITIEERQIEELRKKKSAGVKINRPAVKQESQLRQWPVQIMLVSALAPYLNNADLLVAADCVPFAYADFHRVLLKDKVVLAGCPKLDDTQIYQEKFTGILKGNHIKSITYAHMEVPCCFGLVGIIKKAITESGADVPFKEVVISIGGEKLK